MNKPLNQYFDHTILKPEATTEDVIRLCKEAREHDFYAVCVNSCYIELAKKELEGSGVHIASVVGFPLGACSPEAKAFETAWACEKGAGEIDMVLNVGAMKEKRFDYVRDDIKAVVEAARRGTVCGSEVGLSRRGTAAAAGPGAGAEAGVGTGAGYDTGVGAGEGSGKILVKVILETCLLTDEEIVTACRLSEEAGADFVKTSTGFSTGGATAHHVALMKQTVGDRLQVKASGGIRDLKTVTEMIEAGADRIGASASVGILKESKE